jgi:hypothetical protein
MDIANHSIGANDLSLDCTAPPIQHTTMDALSQRDSSRVVQEDPAFVHSQATAVSPAEDLAMIGTSQPEASKLIISTHKLSTLEKLPNEIIEKIFLNDGDININFPVSSLIIGMKLSSKSTLRKTIIAAFGPCWLHAMVRSQEEGKLAGCYSR